MNDKEPEEVRSQAENIVALIQAAERRGAEAMRKRCAAECRAEADLNDIRNLFGAAACASAIRCAERIEKLT